MADTADIVIVGAGVIGLSIAVQVARRSKARVIVLDRGICAGAGSTGASSAICRHRYTFPETVTLARDGIDAYRHWREFLELEHVTADFQCDGVLWLGDGRKDWPAAEARRLSEHGVRAEVLDDRALSERFPAINPCVASLDLAPADAHACGGGGLHLLEIDAGYMDPMNVLSDLATSARQKGVQVRYRAQVDGLEMVNGRVVGVRLADGSAIDCQTVISASGPWCVELFRKMGLSSPWRLEPTRIQIVHIDRPATVQGAIPVTCDPVGGIYFRTQNRGQQLIIGSILDQDEREFVPDPDEYPAYADDDFMREKLYFLEHRLRGMSEIHRPRGYSGLYTINRQDFHPVVGPTSIEGLLVANGFSGHGFKLAPAIGSLVAQMLCGRADSFDTRVRPDFLAFDRQPIPLKSLGVLA